MNWDHTVDLLIVGSGAGSTPAALQAQAMGKSVLVIEKLHVIGGSTAYSGGVAWFPNTKYLKAAGGEDSFAKARLYIDTLIGAPSPGSSLVKRDAFVRESPEIVEFLERYGMRFEHAKWPDYYSDIAGGTPQGRSLVAPVFDINELGEWTERFSGHPVYRHFPIGTHEGVLTMALYKRTWAGRAMALKYASRMLYQKLTGKRLGASGQSLQGRLLAIALRQKVPFWADTSCQSLVVENGRVTGAVALREGREIRIRAKSGVLLNAGGFTRNQQMRTQYHMQPSRVEYTEAPPGDTGDLILESMRCGAAVDMMDAIIYVAGSRLPDGQSGGFHQPAEVGKPHCIVVDQAGRRFVNETCSYMEFGQHMYAANAVPAWAIFEHRHRQRYTWGFQPPGKPPESWFSSGYAQRANTIEELAKQCDMDPSVLKATVARFNGFARSGVDTDFGRGTSVYNRAWGDPTSKTPNPTMGALERAPFYAVKLLPLDVGTGGGLVTDEHGRVLKEDGSAIDGLYATGNSTASVFGRYYPGAGASISASMVFAYLAAKHACADIQSAGTAEQQGSTAPQLASHSLTS